MRALTMHRGGEDASGPWTRALSGNYLDVRVAGRWPANQFVDVRIGNDEGGRIKGVHYRMRPGHPNVGYPTGSHTRQNHYVRY